MPLVEEAKDREDRITMEIVVDAYGLEEQALGWYYYLEDKLRFPFNARCIQKRRISPLRVGEDYESAYESGATVSCSTCELGGESTHLTPEKDGSTLTKHSSPSSPSGGLPDNGQLFNLSLYGDGLGAGLLRDGT